MSFIYSIYGMLHTDVLCVHARTEFYAKGTEYHLFRLIIISLCGRGKGSSELVDKKCPWLMLRFLNHMNIVIDFIEGRFLAIRN